MNGARTIFRRKGYLLTALAAAVLLAASSGTAYAQSVGFRSTSGTLPEGASSDPRTADPLHLYIDISGIETGDDAPNDGEGVGTLRLIHDLDTTDRTIINNEEDANAVRIWQKVGSDLEGITTADAGGTNGGLLKYDGNGRIELVIIDPPNGEDINWKSEDYSIKLVSSERTVGPSPSLFKLTIIDNEVAPVAKFSKAVVDLTEDSSTLVEVQIRPGTTSATLRGKMVNEDIVLSVMVDKPDLVGACFVDNKATEKAIDIKEVVNNIDGMSVSITRGVFMLSSFNSGGMDDDPAVMVDGPTLRITACEDDGGFRDREVTLSFTEKSLVLADLGTLTDGGSLPIMVQSNEEVPTVSFATSRIDIDEGGTNTVAILATESTGPEVGSVMVSVSGDAMLSLWQDGDMLEAGTDGMYEADLMGNANTILTISADSDRDLENGMSSTGTITLESASGAEIGDRDSVMVTVIGSTAVPALPLVGQLLLALFLMVGGARLYRRRQG